LIGLPLGVDFDFSRAGVYIIRIESLTMPEDRAFAREVPMKMAKTAFLLLLIAAVAAACGMNMLPSNDEWYAQHYFIMQKFETDAYKSMTPEARLEFQQLFWAVRSPSVKREFDSRIAYINNEFKNENSKQPWNTDRARVYLLNGNPASRDYTTNDAWATTSQEGAASAFANSASDRSGEDIQARSMEVWNYPFGRFFVMYGFTFSPPNKWKQANPTPQVGRYLGQFELQNRVEIWGAQDEEAYKRQIAELVAIKK
jgi:GWxTD domain-containing protein